MPAVPLQKGRNFGKLSLVVVARDLSPGGMAVPYPGLFVPRAIPSDSLPVAGTVGDETLERRVIGLPSGEIERVSDALHAFAVAHRYSPALVSETLIRSRMSRSLAS